MPLLNMLLYIDCPPRRAAAAAGALSDTAALADWEAHSRGVASRLLVRMGYVAGKGLGARGE